MRLHGFQLFVIWASLFGSASSAVFSTWACIRLTAWKFSVFPRIGLIITATFSTIYVASYSWLLVHPDRVLDWSNTMRPIALFVWWVGPWTLLPATMIYQGRKMSKRMIEQASDLITEIRGEEGVDYLLEPDYNEPDDVG